MLFLFEMILKNKKKMFCFFFSFILYTSQIYEMFSLSQGKKRALNEEIKVFFKNSSICCFFLFFWGDYFD